MPFDSYRNRVLKNSNVRGQLTAQSSDFINQTFEHHPSFQVVKIEGVETGVRIIVDREYSVMNEFNIMKMQLRPQTSVNRGDIIEITNPQGVIEKWIVIFFQNKGLYPDAHIRFCNNVLTFANDNVHPIVIDNKLQRYQEIEERSYINLPDDALSVAMPCNADTLGIRQKDKFVINNKTWEAQVIDDVTNVYNGKGIVQMIIRRKADEPDEGAVAYVPGGGQRW